MGGWTTPGNCEQQSELEQCSKINIPCNYKHVIILECPPPSKPDLVIGGSLEAHTETAFSVGATCTYVCDPGLFTRSNLVTTCMSDFTWSLDQETALFCVEGE